MNNNKACIITGSSGGIGKSIAEKFRSTNYFTIGLDIKKDHNSNVDHLIEADLERLTNSEEYRTKVFQEIRNALSGMKLSMLVNNAAYQFVSTAHPIKPEVFAKSYAINVIAPYLLATNLSDWLKEAKGSIVNIGSIHSRLTKKGFTAYSTTKAALSALTRGLALDLPPEIRINCIEPASIQTPMLIEGFSGNPEKLNELHSYHPQGKIGTPQEIAELVYFLSNENIQFLHGSTIDISGGISGKLSDPN
jgi:NAD(P)-dependent dehydrogenase (short-subunit alcohol dehydrogenase family)